MKMLWSSLALAGLSVAVASPVDPQQPVGELLHSEAQQQTVETQRFAGVVRTAAAFCPAHPRPYLSKPFDLPAEGLFPTDGDWSSHFVFNISVSTDGITLNQTTVPLLIEGLDWHDPAPSPTTKEPFSLVDADVTSPPPAVVGLAPAGFVAVEEAATFERTGETADVEGSLVVLRGPVGPVPAGKEPEDGLETWVVRISLEIDSVTFRSNGTTESYLPPGRRVELLHLTVTTDQTPASGPATIRDIRAFRPPLVPLFDAGPPEPPHHPHHRRPHHRGRSVWKRAKHFFRRTAGRLFGHGTHRRHVDGEHRPHHPRPARCGTPPPPCRFRSHGRPHPHPHPHPHHHKGGKALGFAIGFGATALAALAVLAAARALFKRRQGTIRLPDDEEDKADEQETMAEKA